MTLDDAAATASHAAPPAGARSSAAAEGEDLFDFPVVEMKLTSAKAKHVKRASASGDVAERAQAVGTGVPAERADAARAEVAAAASSSQGPPGNGPRRAWAFPSMRATALAAGSLLIANLLVWFFSWRSNADLHASLAGLRADLTHAAQELHVPAAAGAPTAAQAQPTNAHAVDSPTAPASHSPVVPLESFERTALALAEAEIDAGEFAAARRRLHRLLAVADRIEASVRDDLEAQAAFSIAESYRREARVRAENAR